MTPVVRCAAAFLVSLALCSGDLPTSARAAESAAPVPAVSESAAAALHELRGFATTGRVLHIAAHPDDENTQLIAFLSRGRGYATAYLSITRGDGGQNLLGPQLDEKLGVARTQELLAARRIDGGRQFFTRAVDFGFSKSPEETLSMWDHQEVLSDVVRVIRRFRPDVIVSRFPVPPGSGGHGHHTASGILALEAFKLAGDEKAFPEQIAQGLAPWQPKRILWNGFAANLRAAGVENNPTIRVDIAGSDPVTGEAFGVIAARSRAMHKTQGFGEFGGRGGSGARLETFVHLGGEPAAKDLMDGVDVTWERIPGGVEIGRLATKALAEFAPDKPEASVRGLLEIRSRLAALEPDLIVEEKRAQLDRILSHCLGLSVASQASIPTVVPGETLAMTGLVRNAGSLPIRWISVECAGIRTDVNSDVPASQTVVREITRTISRDARLSHPYWLRLPGTVGMSRVEDPHLIGMPENGPPVPLTYRFEVGGQTLVIADKATFREKRSSASSAANEPSEPDHPIAIVPNVRLSFEGGVAVFRPGATSSVHVDVTAERPDVAGTLHLDIPEGWRVSGPQGFRIAEAQGRQRVTFSVTAPDKPAVGAVMAKARVDGTEWNTDSIEIHYPHIPLQLLQPIARRKLLCVDVQTRGGAIGYVPGAGDDIPAALRQLGYAVTSLEGTDLNAENLKRFDAVVFGVRAFNTRTDLEANLPGLFAYVENGGTVVCQYNWARDLKVKQIAPYELKLSGDRVTNENATIDFLTAGHPVLTSPNKISAGDFEGWVQERGVYYPNQWDERFVPILSMNDPGEAPTKGALLVAQHGKGHFVYTGLALFRQLPAGVPGAYRLFANLVSLGK